jgi:peptidoglycan/LPS O-acetylase OafA/YrhL
MNSQREEYVDGMKGLACLFVLLGHFTGIYKYAENATAIDSWFTRMLTKGPLSFFTAESFWLYLFFVLSGYLLTMSTPPRKCSEFLKKCIKRVLRLAIPIMGAAVFTFAIQCTIGFYNFKIQDTVSNTWLTHLYGTQLTLRDIIEEPFRVLLLGSSKFNSPFWCLRDMLLASVIIYAVGWLCQTEKLKGFTLGALILLGAIVNRGVIVACLVGAMTGFLRQKIITLKAPNAVAVCGVLSPAVAFFTGNLYVIDVAFAFCLLSVPLVPQVKFFFEADFVKKIGNVSFGIYALHWPVINSIGLGILYGLDKTLNPAPLMLLSLAGVLLVTFVLAIIFKVTVERLTSIACRVVK